MWKAERLEAKMRRFSLLIAYLFLVAGASVAFLYMVSITERIEHEGMIRAYANCTSANESKQVLTAVLDRLAEARPDDEPGDFERRQEMRESVDHILQPSDCPPPPPRGRQ